MNKLYSNIDFFPEYYQIINSFLEIFISRIEQKK